MADYILWRRLTKSDHDNVHGRSAPSGSGGGAGFILLGKDRAALPIKDFFNIKRGQHESTVTTEVFPEDHASSALRINNKHKDGEWIILDQHRNRHPAWTAIPDLLQKADHPVVLIFKTGDTFHCRLATEQTFKKWLKVLDGTFKFGPRKNTGIAPAPRDVLRAYKVVPTTSILDLYEERSAAAKERDDADPDTDAIADERERIVATVIRRQGQQSFRKALLDAYAGRCAISGCRAEAALEAAHIIPYRNARSNVTSNGLLLRADLHTLFDLGLISIHPTGYRILVSLQLRETEYWSLRNKKISLPKDAERRPSKNAIKAHMEQRFVP